MGADDAIAILDRLLQTAEPKVQLTTLQFTIFQRCWSGHSYREIAEDLGYEHDYVKQVGSQLWQLLSRLTGQKVSKTNLQSVFYPYQTRSPQPQAVPLPVMPRTYQRDWGEAIDASIFYGRADELTLLQQWLSPDRCRLVSILGMGGMGKTALSVKLAESVQDDFDYLIWRSLRDAPSLTELLLTLISFLSNQQITTLPNALGDKLTSLIERLRQHRCLIVLDNFDAVLQAGQRAGTYRSGYENYGEFLQRVGETAHQSCVVLTSREKPQEIGTLAGVTLPVRSHTLQGLDRIAGQAVLAAKGLTGSDADLEQLMTHYRGNPLALKMVATSIQDLFDGQIQAFLATGTATFNGMATLLQRQCDRLSESEQAVMFWLAIHREPVTAEVLQTHLVPSLPKVRLMEILESLRWRCLIETASPTLIKSGPSGFTQQPVVMEYITERLIEQIAQEILSESPQRFVSHALALAQTKDYLRDSQARVILQPLLQRLLTELGSPKQLENQLKRLLVQLQTSSLGRSGYGAGNLLHLFRQLETDLTGYDFSGLYVAQASLQDLNLHQVNFAQAEFADCTFAATFGGITCVTFSPDGQRLATSDTNGTIQIWNATSGQPLITCTGHNSWVWGVAFSPTTPLLASCGQDHTVRLWDMQTGGCLKILSGHTSIVTAIAFSADGQLLASSSEDRSIRVWEVTTGRYQQTLVGTQACVWSVAFHPDGKTLLSAGEDNAIRNWDLTSGACLRVLKGHQHWIKAIALNSTGTHLLSGSFDQTVKLWDCQTGDCLRTFNGHGGTVTTVAFSADGRTLASGSYDQTVKLWDMESGQCLRTLHKHTNRVWAIAFHPHQRLLASGADDYTTRLWDLETGQCSKTWQGHSNSVYAIALHAQNCLLASGHEDQTIKLWDFNLKAFSTDSAPPLAQTLSHRPFRVLRGHKNRVFSVAFSPDGQLLASASLDRSIKLWNAHTGQCRHTLHGHQSWVWAVAFHPQGQWLASASYDHTVKLWDVTTGECLRTLEGHTSSVLAIAFSPDGTRLASGGYEQMIKLWDVTTGECLQTLQAHENRVWTVAWSPDRQTLATAGDDHAINLWDISTGQCGNVLLGHTSQVLSLAFSPDGSCLFSAGADKTVRVWDVPSGHLLKTLQGHTNWVWSLALSPDAAILLSASQDETIQVWSTPTGVGIKPLQASRPYEKMNITDVHGLAEAQVQALCSLGAIANP